jgi:hypothetical protein
MENGDWRLQIADCRLRVLLIRDLSLAVGDLTFEGRDVQPVAAGGVELEGVTGDQQEGGLCRTVADGLAEVVEGVAQVAERSPVGPIGPQQPGQYLAAVHAVRFDGQVGQQRPAFGGFKARDRFPVQCDPERPQQGDRQMGHRSCPRKSAQPSHRVAWPVFWTDVAALTEPRLF